jgi:hypothetical protein
VAAAQLDRVGVADPEASVSDEACQVRREDAYDGHLVLRLMGSFILFYTSRGLYKGRLTMEEIIFNLKHYWRFVNLEVLELRALS